MAKTRALSFLFMSAMAAWAANADQFAYITQSQAHEAAAVLSKQGNLRHFCAPCDDESPRSEAVDKVEVQPAGYEDFYEVFVNGAGVDLAYVYISTDEGWVNLALHQGLDAQDVPRLLDVDDSPASLAEYYGTLGETNHLLMTLSRQGGALNGSYFYERIGTAIELQGTVDKEGQVTLTESVDETKTGVFNGRFTDEGAMLKGSWMNPDGSKVLPFELKRFALMDAKTLKTSVGSLEAEATVNVPVIEMGSETSDVAFNKAIRAEVNSYVEGFQHGFLQTHSDESDAEFFRGYVTELGYDIAHYSPRLLSVLFSTYEYTGGAHGNTMFLPLTVLVEEGAGRNLALADLFQAESGFVEKLSAYCIADLKKQEAAWVVDGATESFTAEELSTFTVSRAGVTIHFAPYAVGPYVQGTFQVTVALKEIGGMLKPELKEILGVVEE
jgi:hypothetical protein